VPADPDRPLTALDVRIEAALARTRELRRITEDLLVELEYQEASSNPTVWVDEQRTRRFLNRI
jgi:hypothetical protein